MIVFAQDLNSSVSSEVSTNTTNSTGIDFNWFFTYPVNTLNYFALASSILYSFILLSNFFHWRIYFAKSKMSYEENGVKSINIAMNFWRRYLLCLPVITIYDFFDNSFIAPLLAILAILALLFKLWKDTLEIMNILTYFKWSKKIAKNVKKALKFKIKFK